MQRFHGILAAAALAPVPTVLLGRAVNARRYRIRSPKGVQWSGYLSIGGIPQYVQMRGQDRSNPVLLVLHGGPGSPLSGDSYHWQHPLEQTFTVVHWDQRGCGNTYYRNPGAEAPGLERLLEDLDSLAEQLCRTFGQERILLMGHSWGAYLGWVYAVHHPERLAAYVGVSQMVDFRTSEVLSGREAIYRAEAAGNLQAARSLKDQLCQVASFHTLDAANAAVLLRFRQQKERFLPPQYGGHTLARRLLSPYMTGSSWRWMTAFHPMVAANRRLYQALLAEGASLLSAPYRECRVPVILAAGSRDWTTPFSLAHAFYQQIAAPHKQWIPLDAGHLPFLDQPQVFCKAVEEALLDVL